MNVYQATGTNHPWCGSVLQLSRHLYTVSALYSTASERGGMHARTHEGPYVRASSRWAPAGAALHCMRRSCSGG